MTNVAESGIINTSSTNQTKYYYDSLSQLVREDNPYANKTYTYEYDGNGNIKSKKTYAYTTGTLGSVEDTITYSYGNSDWKDLLTSYDGTTISYDASGNPLNWNDERTITWVGRQLDSIMSPDGARWAFKYDHNGLRTEREYSYSGEVILRSEYTWVDEKLVKEERRDGMNTLLITLEYFYNGEDLIGFSIQEGDAAAVNYYYGKTNNGEIRFIYDANGNIVTTYLYDAWGNPIPTDESSDSEVGRINPFRYKSYYYDSETRLYYLRSRSYDPVVGRFLNADAVELLGESESLLSFDLLVYCENNPILYSDPNGYLIWPGEIHNEVVKRIYKKHDFYHEQKIDYVVGWGRADLISANGEVWEVKRKKTREIKKGISQVKKYVNNKWHNFPEIKLSVGEYIPGGKFVHTTGGKIYIVEYNYEREGVISYDYEEVSSRRTIRIEVTNEFGYIILIIVLIFALQMLRPLVGVLI